MAWGHEADSFSFGVGRFLDLNPEGHALSALLFKAKNLPKESPASKGVCLQKFRHKTHTSLEVVFEFV